MLHQYCYNFTPNNVKVKESTGSGDTFASSFLSGLIEYNDIKKALKLAMANTESIIQQKGTKTGLLTLKQAEKIMRKKRFMIKKETI